VPPVVLFAATVLVALCPLLVPRVDASEWRATARLIPALPLVYVALLVAYVFGEDSYRGNGISRWDAYRSPGGALGPMFVTTVALMTLAAGSEVIAVAQHRGHLLRASALVATAVVLFLGIPTLIGFSSN
jgi:hypothetical protein